MGKHGVLRTRNKKYRILEINCALYKYIQKKMPIKYMQEKEWEIYQKPLLIEDMPQFLERRKYETERNTEQI